MALGEKNKFGALMFQPEVFHKQMYYFEICAYNIVVTFWPPSVSAPGVCVPLTNLVLSGVMPWKSNLFSKINKVSSPKVMNFHSIYIRSFRTQYGMDFARTVNRGNWHHFRFLRVVFGSLLCLLHTFLGVVLCLFCYKNKCFLTISKLLF